jgi:hypothetical protein
MAWDMTRHSYAVANFQWSRVPSLPDLMFFFVMDWASVKWRVTFMLYTCSVAVGAILALGWALSLMRACSYRDGVFWAGMSVTLALVTLRTGTILAPQQLSSWLPQALLLFCNFHGDAFLLSVIACCTALRAIRDDRRMAWVTWILCAVGMFSDTIFPAYFVAPFVVAGLILALRYPAAEAAPTPKEMLFFAAKAGLACFVGWLGKWPLFIQKMQLLSPGFEQSSRLFLKDLPAAPWIVFLLALTAALAGVVLWSLRPSSARVGPQAAEIDRAWLALAGLGASVGSFVLMLFVLYAKPDAFRYALPFLWWPPIIALGFVRFPARLASRAAAAAAAVLATPALSLATPVLPSWRSPLERCLTAHRAAWGLKAGLAPYWESRQTMASSDWTLQVDQIEENGDAYIWGNNFAAFKHDMTAPSRAPEYNFIVSDETIDQIRIEVVYGPPARYEKCNGLDVLIYETPVRPILPERPKNTLEFQFDPLRS